VRSRDTTAKAYEIQLMVHRKLGVAGRFRAAMELSDITHELEKAGFLRRNPECPFAEIPRRLAHTLYLANDSHER